MVSAKSQAWFQGSQYQYRRFPNVPKCMILTDFYLTLLSPWFRKWQTLPAWLATRTFRSLCSMSLLCIQLCHLHFLPYLTDLLILSADFRIRWFFQGRILIMKCQNYFCFLLNRVQCLRLDCVFVCFLALRLVIAAPARLSFIGGLFLVISMHSMYQSSGEMERKTQCFPSRTRVVTSTEYFSNCFGWRRRRPRDAITDQFLQLSPLLTSD